jgi:hypothetical protein
MASISINWSDLIKVAEVSLVFTVGIVAVFAVGILGMARFETARTSTGRAGARVGGALLAGACLLICAAAVGYGVYLLIPQFHS